MAQNNSFYWHSTHFFQISHYLSCLYTIQSQAGNNDFCFSSSHLSSTVYSKFHLRLAALIRSSLLFFLSQKYLSSKSTHRHWFWWLHSLFRKNSPQFFFDPLQTSANSQSYLSLSFRNGYPWFVLPHPHCSKKEDL